MVGPEQKRREEDTLTLPRDRHLGSVVGEDLERPKQSVVHGRSQAPSRGRYQRGFP